MRSHTGELLYRTTDLVEAALIELELVRRSIPVVTSNGDGMSVMGALPGEPFYVELWTPAERLSEARESVESFLASRERGDTL